MSGANQHYIPGAVIRGNAVVAYTLYVEGGGDGKFLRTVYRGLENATQACKIKACYGKGAHSFKILAELILVRFAPPPHGPDVLLTLSSRNGNRNLEIS